MATQRTVEYLSPAEAVAMADEWFDYAYPDHFWMDWRFRALTKLRSVLPPAGARILEVGCGNGVFLKQLRSFSPSYQLEGCDLNPQVLSTIPDLETRVFVYNIYDCLPALKEKYDAIFLMDVIEHVDDDEAFLKATCFHLKKGGIVVINVPSLKVLYSRYDEVAGHKRRYWSSTVTDLFNKCGLRTITISFWGMLLIPVAILRKIILANLPADQIIKVGFTPPNALSNLLLQGLKRVEIMLPLSLPVGTSLLAIAQKDDL